MTDIDIPALKAAALACSRHSENSDDIVEGARLYQRFLGLTQPPAILALIERLERAEAVAEYARSREMPTTEKQVKAAEMFFTAPMMARLEKLEDLAKAARDLGLETVCIADPPCFNCRACRFHLALAVLEAP